MSNSKVYVGSLAYSVSEDDLNDYFGKFGEISEVKLIMDRETNRSKGFAFITYAEKQGAESALSADGQEIQGRKIRVNAANENAGGQRRGGGGGGRRHGGGGRGFGGRGRDDNGY